MTRSRAMVATAGRGVSRTVVLRGLRRSRSARVGMAVALLLVAVAIVGPLVSPHEPSEIVGVPLSSPGNGSLFGTDVLGRDVLSRFLHGGLTVIVVAFLATGLAYLVGITVGMAAGVRRGAFDTGSLAITDILVSFPPVILVLMLVAGAGSGIGIAIVAIALVHAPRITRIVRTVAREISSREYVEAAIASGERTPYVLFREVLPNIWTPVMADFGLRVTGSIILYASLSFLGLGPSPPAADWGLMISENRVGLLRQPWMVIPPALAIAALAISVNLVADSVARSVGRSPGVPDV